MSGNGEVEQKATERLMFFSDAVVAIALTLLAIDLPVPEGTTNAAVLSFVNENSNEYLAFGISFVVIGAQWLGHHRIFRYITAAPPLVSRLNMVWLLMMVLTPFATRVITGDGAFQTRFIFYASVQAVANLALLTLLLVVDRRGLLRKDIPAGQLAGAYQGVSIVAAMFLVSIPVSLFTNWAYLCWIAIPLAARVTGVIKRRRTRT
jgi:uncharacterized membrane protein